MANPFTPTPTLRSVEQLMADFAGPLPEQIKMVNLIYSLSQVGPQLPPTDGVTTGFVPKVQADGGIAWAADTNTTYTVGAAAEMTTGTSTAGRLINATTFPAVLGAALARNTAIAALTSESTLEDVIAALKAG